jgi:DNA repair exonuclease SbcCD ATPase subunit
MHTASRAGMLGLVLTAAFLAASSGHAADSPAEAVLTRNGLRREGPMYVLDAEANVTSKLKHVRLLSKQWNEARIRQAAVGTPADYQNLVRELGTRVTQIRSEITAVNRQLSRVPRFRGRIANNFVQADYAQLAAYRNELNAALNQQNALLSQLKSRPPDPKQAQKLSSDVEARRDEYNQAVSELVELVHSTREKYASLGKNAEVKKALAALEGAVKPSPRLGPTHEFQGIVKLVERLEKTTPEAAAPTAAAKGRKGGRLPR